jgi:hypothetical protein
VADELYDVLTRFHREVVIPDMQRMVGDVRNDMLLHFDALYKTRGSAGERVLALRAAVTRMRRETRSHGPPIGAARRS